VTVSLVVRDNHELAPSDANNPHIINYDQLTPESFMEYRSWTKLNNMRISDDEMERCISALLENFFSRKDAYASNTIYQLRLNWNKFHIWCQSQGLSSLPANQVTVERFLEQHSELHRNTLNSYIWAISKVHDICGLDNVTRHIYVRSTLRAIHKQKIQVQREAVTQAYPFKATDLDNITSLWLRNNSTSKELRDILILSMAYETLLRESEISRVRVGDIRLQPDGSGILRVVWTKTNHTGNDEYAYMSPDTISILEQYLLKTRRALRTSGTKSDEFKDSYLFMQHRRGGRPDREFMFKEQHISRQVISAVFKKAFIDLKLSGKSWSGHSARVGAAQDLSELGKDALEIQHAGRWSSPEMPYRYSHGQSVSSGAMSDMRNSQRKHKS
jgi:site-specific recombinase XerD